MSWSRWDVGAPPINACVASNPAPGDDPIYVYLGPGEQFAMAARLGNWAEVVKSSAGWHMILMAPGARMNDQAENPPLAPARRDLFVSTGPRHNI